MQAFIRSNRKPQIARFVPFPSGSLPDIFTDIIIPILKLGTKSDCAAVCAGSFPAYIDNRIKLVQRNFTFFMETVGPPTTLELDAYTALMNDINVKHFGSHELVVANRFRKIPSMCTKCTFGYYDVATTTEGPAPLDLIVDCQSPYVDETFQETVHYVLQYELGEERQEKSGSVQLVFMEKKNPFASLPRLRAANIFHLQVLERIDLEIYRVLFTYSETDQKLSICKHQKPFNAKKYRGQILNYIAEMRARVSRAGGLTSMGAPAIGVDCNNYGAPLSVYRAQMSLFIMDPNHNR